MRAESRGLCVFRVRRPGIGGSLFLGLEWGMFGEVCKLLVTNDIEPELLSQSSKTLHDPHL